MYQLCTDGSCQPLTTKDDSAVVTVAAELKYLV